MAELWRCSVLADAYWALASRESTSDERLGFFTAFCVAPKN